MKALLINPGERPGEEAHYGALSSPLVGLAYLATCLRDQGFGVAVIEMSSYKLTYEQVRSRLVREQPDLVGITAKTFNARAAYRIAQMARELSDSTAIVLGGPHPSALIEHTFAECPSADAIVRGEGEETLLEVARRLAAGYKTRHDRFADVAGLSFVENDGTVRHNPDRQPISDLDALPFPDFSLYDLKHFGRTYDNYTRRFEAELSLFASRGCPFRCSFCMPHLGRQWRYRSPDNVIAEIQHHRQRFGVRRFCFNDSTFGLDKRWFHELCNRLRQAGLHRQIHWVFETRADLANVELLEDAVAAGASLVLFGFESGSDLVLSKNGKGITRADIRAAVAHAREARVPAVAGNFMIGLPYETRETLQASLDLIPELSLNQLGAMVVSVYPGTELWDMVDRGEGGTRWLPGIRMNWAAYDRTRPQIEMNDLTQHDLVAAASQAKALNQAIAAQKSLGDYLRKCNAFFWYLILHDRKKLAYHVKAKARSVLRRN